ncbi:MGC78845 protein, related [Eimeria maxima]|uniref:MGC78845 protein, related n=1 Tax=Eimeria maxima TaxID=5804 RepID=U6MB46_EIMMA|nr:MGC78845 protein, related [Eimeria maxima]CDJ59689.1 MGC78845 protein, related [Eimeria maxima]
MHRADDEMTHGRKVYVGNLDPESTSTELEEIFRRYGKLSNIWVARNPPGFAFVTFEDMRDARDAVEATDGILHREKYLRVEIAKGPGAKGRRTSPPGRRRRGSPDGSRGRDTRRSPGYSSEGSDYNDYRGRRGRSRSRSADRRRSYRSVKSRVRVAGITLTTSGTRGEAGAGDETECKDAEYRRAS